MIDLTVLLVKTDAIMIIYSIKSKSILTDP